MSFPAIDHLVAHFKAQGIAFLDPQTETDLKPFELKHGLRLPEDFRRYLLVGHPAQPDSEQMEFYGLAALEVYCSRLNSDVFCQFADYSVNSWNYCIRLPQKENEEATVFVEQHDLTLTYRNKIARSFSDFIERYLREGLLMRDITHTVQVGDRTILQTDQEWDAIRNDGLKPDVGIQYLLVFRHQPTHVLKELIEERFQSPVLTWLPWSEPIDFKAIPQMSLQILNRLQAMAVDFPSSTKVLPVYVEGSSCQLAGHGGWTFLAFVPTPTSEVDTEEYGIRTRRYQHYYCLPYKDGVLTLMDELLVDKEPTVQTQPGPQMTLILKALTL